MLATAVPRLPVGPGWSYEFKWDGVRALLDITAAGVRIVSRNGNEVSTAYPELVAVATEQEDALLDGEIVAFVDGRPSFERLQSRMHVRSKKDAARLAGESPVAFVAFDLLRRFGVDLAARPWQERRATLERWLGANPAWTVSPSFDDAAAIEQVSRAHGLEGVVAKRVDSRYHFGARSNDWQKLKFARTGDFVVIGWEAPTARPNDLSSLVLACQTDGVLTFAGKAGSGLSAPVIRDLRRLLTDRDEAAVAGVPRSAGRVLHWVAPTAVVEVEFGAWTGERRLRHPVFKRIRTDKRPEEACGDA